MPNLIDTQLLPLYREDATGLELSEDVVDTIDYIQWFVAVNYPRKDTLFQ